MNRRAVIDLLAAKGISLCLTVVYLLNNLKQCELELVSSLFAHTQVRKDKERGVFVVDVLEVI